MTRQDIFPSQLDDARTMVAPNAIERWVDAGIISPEQAAAIRAFEMRSVPEPTVVPSRRTAPVIAEVLAYVGAALALAGVILVVVRSWSNLDDVWRVAITAGTTVALGVIGAYIPEARGGVWLRLRAVVWLGAGASAAVFGVVIARDVYGTDYGATVAWVAAGCAFVVSIALWAGRNRPVQQAATLIALAVMIGTGAATIWSEGVAGWFGIGVGLTYLAAGVTRRLPNRVMVEIIGSAAVFFGIVAVMNTWMATGIVVGVIAALGAVTLALASRPLTRVGDQVTFGVAGAFFGLNFIPNALGYFSQQAQIATGLVAWTIGAVVLVVGIRRLTRIPPLVEVIGGAALIIGAAITAGSEYGFGKLFGLATAIALIVIGMFPGRLIQTIFGSIGILVFVPWSIAWFFPGENRAPLLVAVSGVLLLVIALLIGRASVRYRVKPKTPTPS